MIKVYITRDMCPPKNIITGIQNGKEMIIFTGEDGMSEFISRHGLHAGEHIMLFGSLARRVLDVAHKRYKVVNIAEFIIALKKYIDTQWDKYNLFSEVEKNENLVWVAAGGLYSVIRELHQLGDPKGLLKKVISFLNDEEKDRINELIEIHDGVYRTLYLSDKMDDISLLHEAAKVLRNKRHVVEKIFEGYQRIHVWKATYLSTAQIRFLAAVENATKLEIILYISPGDKNRPPLRYLRELVGKINVHEKIFVGLKCNVPVEKYGLPTEMMEAEWVMREIKRLLVGSKVSPGDILIIVRERDGKLQWFRRFAKKYGIPIKTGADMVEELTSNPLARVLLQFYNILLSNFDRDEVLSLINNQLFYRNWREKVDKLSRKYGIVADLSSWLEAIKTEKTVTPNDSSFLNEFETLLKDIASLDGVYPVMKHVQNLSLLYKKYIMHSIRQSSDISGQLIHLLLKGLDAITQAVHYLYVALGDVLLSTRDFFAALYTIFQLVKYSPLPDLPDSVLITTPFSFPYVRKIVFIVGLGENKATDDCAEFIWEDLKQKVNSLTGIRVFTTLEERLINEWLSLQDTLNMATEKVIVTYSYMDTRGTKRNPSYLYELINAPECLVPPSEVLMPSDEQYILSETELIKKMVSSTTIFKGITLPLSMQAVYANALNGYNAEIKRMISQEFSEYEGMIDNPKLISSLSLSATGLEKYGECPMKYFFEKVLYLRPLKQVERDVRPRDTGKLVHEILEKTFSHVIDQKLPDNILMVLKKQATEIFSENEKNIKDSQKVFWAAIKKQLMDSDNSLLPRVVKIEMTHLKNENARVVKTEYPFTEDIRMGEFTINVKGRIDRIDASDDTVIITDYKHKSLYGMSFISYKQLQLPFYCEVMLRKGHLAKLLNRPLNEIKLKVRYVSTRYPGRIIPSQRTNQYTDYIRKKLKRYVYTYGLGIRRGIFPPLPLNKNTLLFHKKPRPLVITHSTSFCEKCDFKNICRVDISSLAAKINPLMTERNEAYTLVEEEEGDENDNTA